MAGGGGGGGGGRTKLEYPEKTPGDELQKMPARRFKPQDQYISIKKNIPASPRDTKALAMQTTTGQSMGGTGDLPGKLYKTWKIKTLLPTQGRSTAGKSTWEK